MLIVTYAIFPPPPSLLTPAHIASICRTKNRESIPLPVKDSAAPAPITKVRPNWETDRGTQSPRP